MKVFAAVIDGIILQAVNPCLIARDKNSGKRTAESVALKNFSTLSQSCPLTLMLNLLS